MTSFEAFFFFFPPFPQTINKSVCFGAGFPCPDHLHDLLHLMKHMFSQQSGLEENVCKMTYSSSYSLQNCIFFNFFFPLKC